MRLLFRRMILAGAGVAMAVPAAAQQPRRASTAAPIGLHAYAAIDIDSFSASNTFDAVFSSSSIPAYGGGVDITNLWKHLFGRVAVTHLSKTGTRVFVDAGQVSRLNIPAKLSMTPVELGAGWRFDQRRQARFTPYVGASALVTQYHVTYQFADPSENESASYTGASLFGGVEVLATKFVTVGGEAQFRTMPNALSGASSVSGAAAAYNEKDLGGFTGRLTIGIKFGK